MGKYLTMTRMQTLREQGLGKKAIVAKKDGLVLQFSVSLAVDDGCFTNCNK